MGKITGFKDYERVVPSYEDKGERINHFNEFSEQVSVDEIKKQGARCMDCGVPFCHNGCPLGNIIPDFNDSVYLDEWEPALKQLQKKWKK